VIKDSEAMIRDYADYFTDTFRKVQLNNHYGLDFYILLGIASAW